jgi:nifR3 family TIM-barrel protein
MVSVAGIHYGGETGGQKTWDLVLPHDPEPDIAVQLFGSKPEQFREAASRVQERLQGRLALIDINMACPVPKVTRKGEGSALLDDPALAAEIVRACVEEADVPVTCKIRRSRQPGPEQAPDFARAMEQAGASAIAVHGRTASQLYRGQADWDAVRHVVEAVDVPVIGSGDVLDAHAASAMRAATGVAAVMVGTRLLRKPVDLLGGACAGRGARARPCWPRGAPCRVRVPRAASCGHGSAPGAGAEPRGLVLQGHAVRGGVA